MEGWVKLHRKALENPIRLKDRTAWTVFETLLLLVNPKTGKWSGGRFQLAEYANINPNTCYNALLRLKDNKMVTLSSNTKYTEISICKWKDYQATSTLVVNNKSTTNQHYNKNIRNKESIIITNVINNTSVDAQVTYGKVEVNELWSLFEQLIFPIGSKQKMNRYALLNLLKKYGKEKVIEYVQTAAAANEDQYGPQITNPLELQEKLPRLTLWAKKQKPIPVKDKSQDKNYNETGSNPLYREWIKQPNPKPTFKKYVDDY